MGTGPGVAKRLWYAVVISWSLVAFFTFAALVVAAISVGVRAWGVLAVTVAAYFALVGLFLGAALRAESALRKAFVKMGWSYSIWGQSASSYRIPAAPFNNAGGLRTSLRATKTVRGRLVEALCVDSDLMRRGAQIYVILLTLDREYPAVWLSQRRGLTREIGGAPAVQMESEDFNSRWRVQSSDPEFAHAFLSPQVMDRLLAEDSPPSRLTIAGRFIFVSGTYRQVHAPGRIPLLADLAELIPGGVAAKFSAGGGSMPTEPPTAVEAVLAHDAPRDSSVFARPEPRSWVPPLALALMFIVPVLGPIIAVIMLAVEGRRGVGDGWMLAVATALGFTELVVVVAGALLS